MTTRLFKRLTIEEEPPFRQWARDNYTPGSVVNTLWHPVVRHECEAMNIEADRERKEGSAPIDFGWEDIKCAKT